MPYILSNPFHIGPYGTKLQNSYKRIVNMKAANNNAEGVNPSNLLLDSVIQLPEVQFTVCKNKRPDKGEHFDSCLSMKEGVKSSLQELPKDFDTLAVVGGDHSISIGTGYALQGHIDLSQCGMIYVDAHGDCNTDESSLSKSITGYPLAVLNGMGSEELLAGYRSFISNIVHIGVRDIDKAENEMFQKLNCQSFNAIECELQGMSRIISQALKTLEHCKYIWISIDIDALDPVYFQPDETDELAPGGMTPRELLAIVHEVRKAGKLKVFELVQINEIGRNTPITWLASRLIETAFGLGDFRYGLK